MWAEQMVDHQMWAEQMADHQMWDEQMADHQMWEGQMGCHMAKLWSHHKTYNIMTIRNSYLVLYVAYASSCQSHVLKFSKI